MPSRNMWTDSHSVNVSHKTGIGGQLEDERGVRRGGDCGVAWRVAVGRGREDVRWSVGRRMSLSAVARAAHEPLEGEGMAVREGEGPGDGRCSLGQWR